MLPPRVQKSASCKGLILPFGVEDHHFDPLQAVEGVGHGGTGVAGGGGEDGDLVVGPEGGQTLGHEAAAEILERQGRAVEQLQRIGAIFQLHQAPGR